MRRTVDPYAATHAVRLVNVWICACAHLGGSAIRWCDRLGRASIVCVARDRRLPPQGGLPPVDGVGSDVVEIACDESGFSGTNLLDVSTPVFTHASVDLRVDEAVELIRVLRSGFWWSLNEFKSGQFLRG